MKEKIITTTGIKASVAKKHGLTLDGILAKLGAAKVPDFDKKKELPLGVFVEQMPEGEDIAFTIYTSEERDIEAEYGKLTDAEKMPYWKDGFKRKEVNAPNHAKISTSLGIVEKSDRQKQIEKAEKDAEHNTRYKIAVDMLTQGMDFNTVLRYSQLPKEFVELALKEVGEKQAKKK